MSTFCCSVTPSRARTARGSLRDVDAEHADRAGGRPGDAVDHAQRRRLAGAVRPEQAEADAAPARRGRCRRRRRGRRSASRRRAPRRSSAGPASRIARCRVATTRSRDAVLPYPSGGPRFARPQRGEGALEGMAAQEGAPLAGAPAAPKRGLLCCDCSRRAARRGRAVLAEEQLAVAAVLAGSRRTACRRGRPVGAEADLHRILVCRAAGRSRARSVPCRQRRLELFAGSSR